MLRFILSIAVFGTLFCSKDAPVSPPRAGKAIADDAASDRAVLVAFYKATGGDNWKDNTNWLSEKPLASWHGVSTDSKGRVTSLDLKDDNFTGSLPPALGQLTNLERLSLRYNRLTGSIPSALGQLTNLTILNLRGNQLTGSIPSALGQLTNLTILELGANRLTGSIPSALGQLTNLEWLFLGANRLTGSIPPALGQLTNLRDLYLMTNQLTGSIPSALGQLTNLRRLYLSDNRLTGSIPPALGQLTNLEEIALGGNQLTGCIPNTVQDLLLSDNVLSSDLDDIGLLFCGEDDQLERAALTAFYKTTGGSNWKNKTNWLTDASLDQWYGIDADAFGRVIAIRLDDNGLQGTIPPEIKALTSLKELRLGYNQLTDVTEVGNLTSLTVLRLHHSHSQLGGDQRSFESLFDAFQGNKEGPSPSESGLLIPSTFAQLTNLKLLWLDGNQIGDLSPLATLTNLNLEGLSLNNNQIGDLSPLATLTNLEVLSLNDNQIGDVTPLENLTMLTHLGLNDNQIGDVTPLENLKMLTYLHLGGNQLRDITPLENLKMLTHLRLNDNQIGDVTPLLNLVALEWVDLLQNPLSADLQPIYTLQARGVLVFFTRPVDSVFTIDLVYLGEFGQYQKRKIDAAVQRWMSTFTADVPDYEFTSDWQASCGDQSFEIRQGERIDDVRIYVGLLDLSHYAAGRAWPSLTRANHLPVVGCMEFKPFFVYFGEYDDPLYFLALHEVGHVLGFGTEWTTHNLLQDPSWDVPNGDPHFDGPLAIAAFDEAGGHQYRGAKVPVEGLLPSGAHDNTHWRESVFGDELMTRALSGRGVLSAITLQSLADLGYSVDLSQAEAYTLPAPGAAKPVADPDQSPFCDVSERPEPVYVWEIE